MQRALRSCAQFPQIGQVDEPVAIGMKTRLAVVAAMAHMQCDFRHDEARLTRHIGHNGRRRRAVDGNGL
jgi:hypothetical protein